MFSSSAEQIQRVTGAKLLEGSPDAVLSNVVVDSRQVVAGSLFVAFPGERVDGNDFCGRALDCGAAGVVCTREPSRETLDAARGRGACVFYADDAQEFLDALASWWRDGLGCVVVGITGSSGKTTTKEMTAAVLARKFRVHATKGNLNSTIGAPLTVLACPADAEALVVEMGMNDTGEIARIARVARPHIGVVTNVGVAHIGILGSRDNIAAAKAELLEALPAPDGCPWPARAFLWGGDDYCSWMSGEVCGSRGIPVTTFGNTAACGVSCSDYTIDGLGCAHGTACLPGGATFGLDLNMPGAHCVIDAMAAAGVGELLGVEPCDIAAALAEVKPIALRQQVLKIPGGVTLIDDSYNANTDSMRRAVDVLCAVAGSRHIACLGDMGELGEREDAYHAAIGAYVAGKGVDVLVCVGRLSEHMADAAELMGMGENAVLRVRDAAAAGDVLRQIVREGDVVLVKASRSTGLDATVKAMMQR